MLELEQQHQSSKQAAMQESELRQAVIASEHAQLIDAHQQQSEALLAVTGQLQMQVRCSCVAATVTGRVQTILCQAVEAQNEALTAPTAQVTPPRSRSHKLPSPGLIADDDLATDQVCGIL